MVRSWTILVFLLYILQAEGVRFGRGAKPSPTPSPENSPEDNQPPQYLKHLGDPKNWSRDYSKKQIKPPVVNPNYYNFMADPKNWPAPEPTTESNTPEPKVMNNPSDQERNDEIIIPESKAINHPSEKTAPNDADSAFSAKPAALASSLLTRIVKGRKKNAEVKSTTSANSATQHVSSSADNQSSDAGIEYTIDGHGDPESKDSFPDAVRPALYSGSWPNKRGSGKPRRRKREAKNPRLSKESLATEFFLPAIEEDSELEHISSVGKI